MASIESAAESKGSSSYSATWDVAPEAVHDVAAAAIGIPESVKRAMWAWFEANRERVLLKKRILFFSVSVKVADLRFLFERIFGAEPA